jgi:hypothetical protein
MGKWLHFFDDSKTHLDRHSFPIPNRATLEHAACKNTTTFICRYFYIQTSLSVIANVSLLYISPRLNCIWAYILMTCGQFIANGLTVISAIHPPLCGKFFGSTTHTSQINDALYKHNFRERRRCHGKVVAELGTRRSLGTGASVPVRSFGETETNLP